MAIDYGRSAAVAVLAWPDGRWTPLWFDGSPVLSTAVHVGAGSEPLVGAAAWAAAAEHPVGFVDTPLTLLDGPVRVGDAEVDAQALVAATLRRIAAEAARAGRR